MSWQSAGLDNAAAERFFGRLTGARTARRTSDTRQDAQADVMEYLEMFYNSRRLHAPLGYRSPNGYEALHRVA